MHFESIPKRALALRSRMMRVVFSRSTSWKWEAPSVVIPQDCRSSAAREHIISYSCGHTMKIMNLVLSWETELFVAWRVHCMLRIPVLALFHRVCAPYCPELVPRNSSSNFSPAPLTFEANIIPECLRQLSCPPVPDFRVQVQSDPPQARHLAHLGCSEPQTVLPGCTLSAQTLVLEETNQVIMHTLLNPSIHTYIHTWWHSHDARK